jgi:hypothetical protein
MKLRQVRFGLQFDIKIGIIKQEYMLLTQNSRKQDLGSKMGSEFDQSTLYIFMEISQ